MDSMLFNHIWYKLKSMAWEQRPGSLTPKLHPLMRIKDLVTIQHFAWPSDSVVWHVDWPIRVNLEQLSSLICCVPCEERKVVVAHIQHELSCKIWPFLGQSEKATCASVCAFFDNFNIQHSGVGRRLSTELGFWAFNFLLHYQFLTCS